jgi:hypothetical protein
LHAPVVAYRNFFVNFQWAFFAALPEGRKRPLENTAAGSMAFTAALQFARPSFS